MATAAPAQTNQASAGLIDDKDVEHWKQKFSDLLAKPSEHLESKSAETARDYHSGLFECFMPIDTCLIGTFCPCVLFGRVHHRVHKNGSLEGFNWLNTSCLFAAVSGVVPCLPLAIVSMQRSDVRRKYDLQGSCVSDILISWCCGCCSIIQQDNEAAFREGELAGNVKEQYKSADQMTYPQ